MLLHQTHHPGGKLRPDLPAPQFRQRPGPDLAVVGPDAQRAGVGQRDHLAAAVLGAPPSRVRREIDLPLLARPLAVAAGLAFAVALGEFGATVFVVRADWPTLPVAIFRFLGRPGSDNAGTAMALCVVLMALVAVASLVSQRAVGRGSR